MDEDRYISLPKQKLRRPTGVSVLCLILQAYARAYNTHTSQMRYPNRAGVGVVAESGSDGHLTPRGSKFDGGAGFKRQASGAWRMRPRSLRFVTNATRAWCNSDCEVPWYATNAPPLRSRFIARQPIISRETEPR